MTELTREAAPGAVAKPLDAFAVLLVVTLCFFWGFNQVAVKLALPDIPPLVQATVRAALGAVIVVAIAQWRGVNLSLRDGTLIPGLVAGVLFGLEFILFYRA